MRAKLLSWLFLFAGLALGGCAIVEPLKSEDLVVTAVAGQSRHVGVVLAVQPVGVAKDTASFSRPSIDRRAFEAGLVGTLAASRIFDRVVPGTEGDYVLASEIITQEPLDPRSITIPILIHYRLIEAASRRTVWKRNIFTQPLVPFERSLEDAMGEKRHNHMLREGFRENFSRLVAALRELQLQQRP